MRSSDGSFEVLELQADTIRMRMTHPDHPPLVIPTFELEVDQELDLGEMSFKIGGELLGVLTGLPQGAEGERMLAGLEMRISNAHGDWGTIGLRGREIRSSKLVPGRYALTITGDNVLFSSRDVIIDSGTGTRIQVALEPGIPRRVRLRVATGAKAPRFVGCILSDSDGELMWSGGAQRQKDGSFEVRLTARTGDYTLVVTTPAGVVGMERLEFRVGAQDAEPLEVILSATPLGKQKD